MRLVILLLGLGASVWWVGPSYLAGASPPRAKSNEPGDEPGELSKPPLRVLFIGNSYTGTNDMPDLLRHMVAAGNLTNRLDAVKEVPGGRTFRQHWEAGRCAKLMREGHFDWVVLQDQSEVPSFPLQQLERDMFPYVDKLQQAARASGARPLLFMTWGHAHGNPENFPGDTFEAMQARLARGYETAARRQRVPVAPVGLAWQKVVRQRPQLPLWSSDGSHPLRAGSYLAACVFYEMLFGRPCPGNTYTANLPPEVAAYLQQVAHDTVHNYQQP